MCLFLYYYSFYISSCMLEIHRCGQRGMENRSLRCDANHLEWPPHLHKDAEMHKENCEQNVSIEETHHKAKI